MSSRDGHPQLSRKQEGVSSMNIYISDLSDTFVADLQDYPMPAVPEDSWCSNWGGTTWTKESYPDHPFVGGKIQKKKVEEGTHHLLGGVSVVDPNGNIIRMKFDEYKNQSEYVHIQSDEGYIRRGLDPVKDRKTNLGKKLPLSKDASQRLIGEDRTEAQKKSSKEHGKKMKGIKLWPNGRVFSDKHRAKLCKPKKSMKFKEYKCPHCGKEGRGNSMIRWHFDNCKSTNK
jgi:hypothetical protein